MNGSRPISTGAAAAAAVVVLSGCSDASGSASSRPVVKAANSSLSRQLTYAGHPLYRFSGDQAPGQATGEGMNAFGAEWYVVSPAGRKIDEDAE